MNLPSNWLITGGCGFIGTSLIARLRKEHAAVNIRILDNLSVGSRDDLTRVTDFIEKSDADICNHPEGVELLIGDIRNAGICDAAALGIDVIVHLAANTGVAPSVENPRHDLECNVTGTFNMLEAARVQGIGQFILASSGAPLGEVEPPIHEEKAPHPVSPYGASKLAGEGYCSAYSHSFGVKTVALRFGNVYGPLSVHKNSVVAKFFKLALSGKALEVYGDGDQTRDFLYIDDLTEAIFLAVMNDVDGEVFQVATFRETTVNEIAQAVRKIVAEEKGIEVSVAFKEPRLGDVSRNFSDIGKARRLLGFEPKTDLPAGLKQTFSYFMSRHDETSCSYI